jgi:membrane protein
MTAKDYLSLVKDTFTEWSNDKAPRMGAALAYYTAFSLAPLLIIAIALAGMVFGDKAARGEITEEIGTTVGPTAARSIEELVAGASAPEGNILMTVAGVVILLIGASGVFVELQESLNTIWKVPMAKTAGFWNMVRQRFVSFGMVLGIGFLLLVSLVASAALAAAGKYLTPEAMPGGVYLWEGINWLVSLAFITLLFGLIYKVLPDVDLRWRDVAVGAAVTAFLFTLGKFAIGLYLGQSTVASSFGAAGSLVVVLVWVYYSAQILLFGAEFTRLYSTRTRAARHEEAPRPTVREACARELQTAGTE